MRRVLLLIAVLGLLVSCASASDSGAGAVTGAASDDDVAVGSGTATGSDGALGSDLVQPVGGDLRIGQPWYLVGGMLDSPRSASSPATLTFKKSRVRGQGPINSYGTTYVATDTGSIEFGEWTTTLKGGSEADIQLEAQIQAHLREVDGYTTVAFGELYLFDADRNVLVYATEPPSDEPTIDDETQGLALQIIGMSESAAQRTVETAGRTFRVVARDGTALLVTEDYSVTRINATVVDDEVTETSIG